MSDRRHLSPPLKSRLPDGAPIGSAPQVARLPEGRYGLGGEHPRTLAEVGRTFNVTRERIRQIENQSLRKLQNLREAQRLRDDVEIASGYAQAQPGHGT